jgi:saccharopepsin
MSLTGVWQNSYGSVMSLTQSDDGLVSGRYSSSTGSTGTYHVLGHAAPTTPSANLGQAVSLTIFWRSIDPGTPDPSWHWVSGLGGQLLLDNGVPTLILLHAMVATDDFPAVAPPGCYLDKLIYLPKSGIEAPASTVPPAAQCSSDSDPLSGQWICEQDEALTLQLDVYNAQYGAVNGTLTRSSGSFALYGFTDSYAVADGLLLQGVALAIAFDPNSGRAECLAGQLNRGTDRLEFTVFNSRGTAAGASYAQTAGSALSFRRC